MASPPAAAPVSSGLGRENHTVLFVSPTPDGRGAGHMDILRSASVSSVAFSVDACVCACVCLRPGAGNKRASVKFDNNVLQRSCQDWGGRWGRKAEGVGGELQSQKATPKRLAQVLCREKVRGAAAPSRGVCMGARVRVSL